MDNVVMYDGPIVLVESDSLDGWFTVEKAPSHHEGVASLVPAGRGSMSLFLSARLGNACVEGPWGHMVTLARGIVQRTPVSERRCAIDFSQDGQRVLFWSPRNSSTAGSVPLERAEEWARSVLERERDNHYHEAGPV